MTPRERRQVAVAYLRSVPQEVADKHVNMRAFAWRAGYRSITLEQLLTEFGTTACVAGLLCLVPPLMEGGLVQHSDGYPIYGKHSDLKALMEFFSLTMGNTIDIFYSYRLSGKAALDEVCRQLEAIP